jgi:hypothetical protein
MQVQMVKSIASYEQTVNFCIFNYLSWHDSLTHDALLCIVVDMTSLHVMHVSNYTTVDIMTVSNANLYSVLARSSSASTSIRKTSNSTTYKIKKNIKRRKKGERKKTLPRLPRPAIHPIFF